MTLEPIEAEPVTTKRELIGYWAYNSAMSGVGQLGRLILFPLLLDSLARGAGTFTDHPDVNCTESDENVLLSHGLDPNALPACLVTLGGSWSITTVAYANYSIGVAVLLQGLLFLSIASFADYGRWRKLLMIIIGCIGAFTCMIMPVAHTPDTFLLCGLLTIVAGAMQSVSYIFLDSYFPLLTRNDPKVLRYNHHMHEIVEAEHTVLNEEDASPAKGDAESEFSQDVAQKDTELQVDDKHPMQSFDERGNTIQAYANMASFGTGFASIVLGAIVLRVLPASYSILGMEFLVLACGVYWLGLGIFCWMSLQQRPGPPLPKGANYLTFSWKEMGSTIMSCRQVPNTFYFLISFFFYSDGMFTLAQLAILFCREKLGMTNAQALVVAALFPITGLIGNIVLLKIQQFFKISTKRMLMACVIAVYILPVYAGIGLFSSSFGIVNQWEGYLVSAWYGVCYAGISAFGKVLFTELVPKGSESRFFALSAFADRGSSWIGTVMVGAITDATKDVRYGMISLLIMFIFGFPFLCVVNMQKGAHDARVFSSKHQSQTTMQVDDQDTNQKLDVIKSV